MDPTSSSAKEIFLDALEAPADERRALIDARCEGDADLAARVERLIAGHERSSTLFGAQVPGAIGALPGELRAGTRIGDYELRGEIGAGGFAVVWRAEQLQPVRRTVALKVLKAGMDTREVVQRFEVERQALAMMDHPCIARVFDGGATESGRPWFAMELVDGVPITQYCDRHALGKPERLRLFREACRAVQHAHQKGVIHRDLKPSNVLVGIVDGVPMPKVIDFGIAKAVERDLTEHSIRTLAGQVIGTPAYMSPEQADETSDIDTRCDVYALGALLYELLSGVPPFEETVLRNAGLSEVLRVIREEDPPRPSTRLGSETRVLAREVRGDLDWIVMRCLEKDRERRYDSAGILANEIDRHLAGEPVLAGPPDLSYRVSKFVRRHRISLGATATIIVLLAVGVVVSWTQLVRARAAERKLVVEAQKTQTELAKYQSTSGFLESILMGVDPGYAQGEDTRLLQRVLDQASARVAADSAGVPEVEASLRRVIGGAYQTLGRLEQAEQQLAQSLELREQLEGVEPARLRESRLALGSLFLSEGRIEEAAPLLEAGLPDWPVAESVEPDLEAFSNFAVLRLHQGRTGEAEDLLREVEARRAELHGEADARTIRAMNNLGMVLSSAGRPEEAAERYTRAAELQLEVQGPRHPETLKAFTNLGGILVELGRTEEAAGYLYDALAWKREVLPDGDASLLVSYNNLARLHQRDGRAEEAEQMYLEAREMIDRTETSGMPNAIILRINYARMLAEQRRVDEAEAEYDRASTAANRGLGEDAKLTLMVDNELAWSVHVNGSSQVAAELAAAVVERAATAETVSDADRATFRACLGSVLLALDRRDEARVELTAAMDVLEGEPPSPWWQRCKRGLAELGPAPAR